MSLALRSLDRSLAGSVWLRWAGQCQAAAIHAPDVACGCGPGSGLWLGSLARRMFLPEAPTWCVINRQPQSLPPESGCQARRPYWPAYGRLKGPESHDAESLRHFSLCWWCPAWILRAVARSVARLLFRGGDPGWDRAGKRVTVQQVANLSLYSCLCGPPSNPVDGESETGVKPVPGPTAQQTMNGVRIPTAWLRLDTPIAVVA